MKPQVRHICLPNAPDGSKVGVDDYLLDHTADDLKALADKPKHLRAFAEKSQDDHRPSQATRLVALASDVSLTHTPEGEPFATFRSDGHQENWPVRSKTFKQWLRRRFWNECRSAPSSQAVQDALGILEGKALFEGPELSVFTRIGEHEGAVYLDLANSRWEAIEITGQRWRVVSSPPVKFRRAKGMLALPHPVAGGSIEDLRHFVNVKSDRDWVLLSVFLVAMLNPEGPYPVLMLHGEQGSAKSTLAEFLRDLIDPNTAPLRTAPRDERDLMLAAKNAWILVFDNLSSLRQWLSDAICRLATGGGLSTRTLYENDEETLFQAQRPVILNGIEELATRGDLLDRAIILYLPEIDRAKRVKIKSLRREFEMARPRIVGALLDVMSSVLRELPHVNLATMPRMADFAALGVAAEEQLGFERGAFMNAYDNSRDDTHSLVLDSSPVGPAVRDLVAKGDWSGTAGELLYRLNDDSNERERNLSSWPKVPAALSNILRRLAPSFRGVDVDLQFYREPGGQRRRIVSIGTVRDTTVPTVPRSTESTAHQPVRSRDGQGDTAGDGAIAVRPATVPVFVSERDGRDSRDGEKHASSTEARRRTRRLL
jgi:hypothetical protein